ncbi:collectin-10-like [Branchiostoma lanceolatum]|uniref:collectin-10-like n=1 Tax=Branchiostoma lanceolatum TaxID=7740 RepID=UPI003451839D
MYEQAQADRCPFSGPRGGQTGRTPSQTSYVRQRNGASDRRQEGQGSSSDTYEEAERVYYTIKDEDLPLSLRGAGQQQKLAQPGLQISGPPPSSDKRQEGQGSSSGTYEEAERAYYATKDEDLPLSLRGVRRQQESAQPGVQISEPQNPPVHQSGSRGRGRHGNDASDKLQEEQEASSHTYEEAEVVKLHATSAGSCSIGRCFCFIATVVLVGSGATITALLILMFYNTQELDIQTPNPTQDSRNWIWTTFNITEPAVIATTASTNPSILQITDGKVRHEGHNPPTMTEPPGKIVPILPEDAGPVGPPGPSGPPGPPSLPEVPLSAGPTYPNPDGPPERPQTNIRGRSDKVSCPGGYAVFRGICYKLFETKKTFSEAFATCRADGGTLAIPRDDQINDFLISLCHKPGNVQPIKVWFGLHDRREEGKFEWVDGSPLGEYNSWGAIQPNEGPYGRLQNCVYYWAWSTLIDPNRWYNGNCDLQHRFVCQVFPDSATA